MSEIQIKKLDFGLICDIIGFLFVIITFFKSKIDGSEAFAGVVGGHGLVGSSVSCVDAADLQAAKVVQLRVQVHGDLVPRRGGGNLLVVVEPEILKLCDFLSQYFL